MIKFNDLENQSESKTETETKTPPPGDSPTHPLKNINHNTLSLPTDPAALKIQKTSIWDDSPARDVAFCARFGAERLQNFENLVICKKLAKNQTGKRLQQCLAHWKKAACVIKLVDLPIRHWSYQAELFYNAATDLKLHPTYFSGVLKLINEFGKYISMVDDVAYGEIKAPTGFYKGQMMAAVEADPTRKRPNKKSKPLSPLLLAGIKDKMRWKNWYFLYVSMWFGLRPNELREMLKNREKMWRVVETSKGKFLDVYQGKLQQIDRDKRWKRIPVVEVEQHKALHMLQLKQLKCPSVATVQKYLGPEFGLYAGRKGFTVLMLSRGWQLQDISLMLGHKSIKTTTTHYAEHNELLNYVGDEAIARKKAPTS